MTVPAPSLIRLPVYGKDEQVLVETRHIPPKVPTKLRAAVSGPHEKGRKYTVAHGTDGSILLNAADRLEMFAKWNEEDQQRLHAAYQCIIDATKAFTPPTEGSDVRKWFDDHADTIDAVLEWKKND